MKKILSIILVFVVGVLRMNAQSNIEFSVHVASDSQDMGYVTASSSSTQADTYTTTTYSYKGNATRCGRIFTHRHGDKSKPGYIYARPAEATADKSYYLKGWSTTNNADEIVYSASYNEPFGTAAYYCDKKEYTGPKNFYAHFGVVEKRTMILSYVTEGGTYTADYSLNGTPSKPTITNDPSTTVTLTDIEDPNAYSFKLVASPTNGYRFFRWRIVYTDGTEAYNNNASTEITFAKSGTLYCEFIDAKYAQFIVKGASNAYHKLSDAIIAAQSSASKVVVVKESGTLFKETEEVSGIYQNNTYTIPAGITLLVPGDADYTVRMGELGENDFNSNTSFTEYKKLSVTDGQDFILSSGSNICVHAKISNQFDRIGLPYQYGWLVLGDDSHIHVSSGANLSVLGYITGDYSTSSVTVESGGSVREIMQIADWRGGDALTSAIAQSKPAVFPFSQYYIQSIETKLILKSGALEYVSTGVTASSASLPINVSFVTPSSYEYGMFKLGTAAQLIKYYDIEKDRNIYQLQNDGTAAAATAALGNLIINIKTYGEIDTKDYVMPMTNNMDIFVESGCNLTASSDVAFLAGSTFTVEKGAVVETINSSSVYLYDAEQHHVQATKDAGNEQIITKGTYYNYFGAGNTYLKKSLNRPGGVKANRSTDYELNSTTGTYLSKKNATLTINGEVKGAVYTTLGGASITSEEGGKVTFSDLVDGKTTHQLIQYSDDWVIKVQESVQKAPIPLSASPLLLNADGSYTEANATSYTYYKNAPIPNSDKKGRWLSEVPTGNIIASILDESDNFALTIPEIAKQNLHFTPSTDVYTINSITNVVFSANDFALQESSNMGEIKSDGTISIPIQYTPTKTHDTNVVGTVTITLVCTNNISGEQETIVVEEITLSATENYLPAFKINDEETSLQFATMIGAPSEPQSIKINPAGADVANVADEAYKAKNYVVWTYPTLPVGSPFKITGTDYYAGVQVVYNPTSTDGTVDGKHTEVLTIKAKYADGVETTKEITLIGTPTLATNPLAFIAEEKEIDPNQTIYPLFEYIGNRQKITFTYNDATTSDIVEIIPEIEDGQLIPAEEKFTLKVKDGVDITTQQVITIKATQSANNQFGQGASQIKVIITPEAQWEWSKLYFGHEYTTPITRVTGNDWTLTQQTPCDAITSFESIEGGEKNYKIVVGGNGPGDECEVTFLFKRNPTDPGRTFTSAIYADPRILPICFGDDPKPLRTFNDITVATNNVEYSDGILFNVTESAGASWTMQLIGVPDQLQFTPTTTNAWTIYESTDGSSWGAPTVNSQDIELDAEGNFTHQLKATTQYIRIICGLGTEQGKITNLCITELDDKVTSTTSMAYLPIVQDDAWKEQISPVSVELQYVSVGHDLLLSMQDEGDNPIEGITIEGENLSENRLPGTTADETSRVEKITIKSTTFNPADSKGTIYLVVKNDKGENKLRIPIRYYHYPQSLPLISANWKDDDAERYNFYVVQSRSQYVSFDASTQEVVFQTSGTSQRFITFAFKGGPSYVQFETSTELTSDNWANYWSIEVSDGESPQVMNTPPTITPITSGENTYYQVRWEIPYTSKTVTILNKQTVVAEKIKNIVIDGTPDLDVVQGNHTIEHEGEANFTLNQLSQDVIVTPINLSSLTVVSDNNNFTVKLGEKTITKTPTTLTSTDCPGAIGNYEVGNITFNVEWNGVNVVEEGELIFTDADKHVLGRIRLLGTTNYILEGNASSTGLFTGVSPTITEHPFKDIEKKYQYVRTPVDLSNTFDKDGVALFDYLIVYGETETVDNTATITAPTASAGSNAKTPYYIYRKAQNPETGIYDRYQFVYDAANANVGMKAKLTEAKEGGVQLIPHAAEGTDESTDLSMQYLKIDEGERLSVYITGFCPYASTGYTKDEEGVWTFRGKKNAKLDVYLENCHIYSRNKTLDGHTYTGKDDPGANIFQADYTKGSGGVLVFECNQSGDYLAEEAFDVTIHTRGKNLLKSNFGCFYEIYGMRAYQVSSPVQIRLTSDLYVEQSKTHLTFDDLWPTELTTKEINGVEVTSYDSIRTNGFISLQKKENNAPSIDMGNANTVVNFRGGQVELQNAKNVSDKYKTTMAISHRSGIMAAGGIEVQMAYGIGTDDALGGVVNFYDGTITVIPLEVTDPIERNYYLMDPQLTAEGDTVKDANGNVVRTNWTTCLRCPQNTYVYGGSICMLRACMSPTSQGGAPTDGPGKAPLGRFFYKEEHGYTYNTADGSKPTGESDATQWLVKPQKFPTDITLFEGLSAYYTANGYNYGLKSVTPNEDGQLILWIPDGYGGVKAEDDRYLTTWKACMPEIGAVVVDNAMLYVGGTVGGEVGIANNEDVDNLLYCNIDDNVYDLISEHTGDDPENYVYTYEAPVKVPDGFKMDDVELFGDYMRLNPSYVGGQNDHMVNNTDEYDICKKVYYITSVDADVWQTFTAPFDVEKIWIVETYDELELQKTPNKVVDGEELPKRASILIEQARHNADFAAFFGVAMALGSQQSFDEIFEDYLEWARLEDEHEGDPKSYTKRGRMELIPYDGTNWNEAHFYLNHNVGNWELISKEDNGKMTYEFKPAWEIPVKDGNILMRKDHTYSMLFPYCTGCWDDGGLETRTFWDYWSGKFLIFESTTASKEKPHKMHGSNFVAKNSPDSGDWVFPSEEITSESTEAILTGNSTFAHMNTERTDVFEYTPEPGDETFKKLASGKSVTIYPTTAFLVANPVNPLDQQVVGVRRTGEIIYDDDTNGNQNGTSGHMPTVGGGNDLFITSIAGGVNVAVAAPQNVRVLSSTGAVIYSGYVTTAVDIQLPTNGIYIVSGENEVQKILF